MPIILPTVDATYGGTKATHMVGQEPHTMHRQRCPTYRSQNITLTLKEIEVDGQSILHSIETRKNGA